MSAQRIFAALAVAVAVAVPAEGLRRWAYNDSGGVLTVCYGTTGEEVKHGKEYSLEECRKFLADDMLASIEAVEKCSPGLPPHQLAAFADLVYNVGEYSVCDPWRSSIARLLAQGRAEDACRRLPNWNKAQVGGVLVELPGLTKRRERAMQLCLTGQV